MRKIIIASHGNFSKGIYDSIKMIIGDLAQNVQTYSLKPGANAEDFKNELMSEIENNNTDEYVIFTDLYGASVCNSMTPLSMLENVKVFAGFNINIILETILSYPNPLTKKDVDELLEQARAGLRFVELEKQEEEDF